MVEFKSKTAKYVEQLLLLLLGLFLDGALKNSIFLFNKPTFEVSLQITLIFLVLMVLHDSGNDNHLFWYGILIGVFYDSYYSRIFGLYTIIFPLTAIFAQMVRDYIPESLIFDWSSYFIILTLAMVYLYLIGAFLNLVLVDVTRFVTDWLGPTLLVNSVIFVFLYFPLVKLIDWLKR